MPSSKTIILAAMPSHLSNIGIQQHNLQQSPAFRKTIVPGGVGKSLLGIRPAVTTIHPSRIGKPVSIEIKLESQFLDTDSESLSTRKRQRLDHLTMEEKLMRRKLKNRVAAQTARDRKKARMDELEDLVSNLEKQVDIFRSENARLHKFAKALETENKSLKEKLELKKEEPEEVKVKQEVSEELSAKEVNSIEHAWPISAPLQKEQDLTSPCTRWTKPSTSWQMIVLSLMIYLSSCNNAGKISSTVPLMKLLESLKKRQIWKSLPRNDDDIVRKPTPWWGPQQKSWNPSKN